MGIHVYGLYENGHDLTGLYATEFGAKRAGEKAVRDGLCKSFTVAKLPVLGDLLLWQIVDNGLGGFYLENSEAKALEELKHYDSTARVRTLILKGCEDD